MTRKNSRKSKAKPIGPPEIKKPRKEAKKIVASQVAAVVPPPAESPKKVTTPEPMDSSAPPARSVPPRGPQCFKCQRWGHVSYACTHDTRCVKCALGHRAAECPKKAVDPCCCANCGGSHPASYRGCAEAPKTRRRNSKPKTKQQDQGKEKGIISKLANVLCKLMITKDFFTEAQLEIISQELDDKPKTKSSHASTQVNIELVSTSRTVGTSTDDLQPELMEDKVIQAPPIEIEQATPPEDDHLGITIRNIINNTDIEEDESSEDYQERVQSLVKQAIKDFKDRHEIS